MSNNNLFDVFKRMPKKVNIGDITIRDGLQHEEHFIPTRAKIYYLQELAFAGVKRMEVTNLGNPRNMPQFEDAEELLKAVHSDLFKKRLAKRGVKHEDIEWLFRSFYVPGIAGLLRYRLSEYRAQQPDNDVLHAREIEGVQPICRLSCRWFQWC